MKMARKFSLQQTFRFVELLKEHECLWNYNEPTYKNKKSRLQALKEIMRAMGFENIDEVRKKIKSIRDTYNSVRRKIEKNKSMDENELYENKLSWYDLADSFLSLCPRREFINNVEELQEEFTTVDTENNQSTFYLETETSDLKSTNSSVIDVVPKKIPKRMKREDRKHKLTSHIESELDTLDELNEPSNVQEKDEHYYFGQTIAAQLRTLPITTAISLQFKIQKLMFDQRLHYENIKLQNQ